MNSIKGYIALLLGFLLTVSALILMFGDGFTWGPLYSSDRIDGGFVLLLLIAGLSSFAVAIAQFHINKDINSENLTANLHTSLSTKSESKESDPIGKFYEICTVIFCIWLCYIGYDLLNTGTLPQGKSGGAFDVQLTGFSKYLIGSILIVPLCVLVVSKIKKYKKL